MECFALMQKPVEDHLLLHNTSFASWNVPRTVNLTSAGIQSFFSKLRDTTEDARHKMEFVDDALSLPRTPSKFEKAQGEHWISL